MYWTLRCHLDLLNMQVPRKAEMRGQAWLCQVFTNSFHKQVNTV